MHRRLISIILIGLIVASLLAQLIVLPATVKAQSDPYLDNKVFHAVDNSGDYDAGAQHNLTQAYTGYIVVSVAFKKGSATYYEGIKVGNSAGELIAYLGTKEGASTWQYYDYATTTFYDTGISVDTSEHNFTIAVNTSAQTVEFYIDGSKVGSFTSSRATDVYFIVLATGRGSATGSENWFDNVVVKVNGTIVFQDDFEDGTWDDNWFHVKTGGAPPSGVTFEVITISPPPFTLSNAESPLNTPTYEGSGQAVHPSILYFESGFSYSYVMAFTPYPNGNDDYENPSVIFSMDGITWTEDGVSNPLDLPPDVTNYHLCDTDIVWNGTAFLLYYLLADHSTSPYTFTLKVLVSKDGVNWDGPYSLFSEQGMLSPAIIYDRDEGKYKMWYVSKATSPNTVWYRESTDGFNWSSPIQVTFAASGLEPWHPEVQKLSNGMYLMLIAMYPSGGSSGDTELYLATSWDGLNWKVYDYAPVLAKGTSGSWDEQQIYRASFIVYDSVLYVWYSARNSATVWHIGFTYRDISDFLGAPGIFSDNVHGLAGATFDHSGGGYWEEYMSFPVTKVPSEKGHYKLVINGSEWKLYNATGYLEASGTNTKFWSLVQNDGDDIRVFDQDRNQLYFWIRVFNYTKQYAEIWVLVPSNITELNIAYGNSKALSSVYNNVVRVGVIEDDFDDGVLDPNLWENGSVGAGTGTVEEVNGSLHLVYQQNTDGSVYVKSKVPITNNYKIMVRHMIDEEHYADIALGFGDAYPLKGTDYWHVGFKNGYFFMWQTPISGKEVNDLAIHRWDDGSYNMLVNKGAEGLTTLNEWHTIEITYRADGTIEWYHDGTLWLSVTDTTYLDDLKYLMLSQGEYSEGWGGNRYIDYVLAVMLSDPADFGTPSIKSLKPGITLPVESVYLIHYITYSPNATQFSHNLTATNATTAGYETNYTDAWGWRVYAEPYQSGGASYENTASLVSEVNITLPYTGVLVKNITLSARVNGTGSYRQLWIRVLNSSGDVVAELINATMGTDWTEVVLQVNANLSNMLTIWINATVTSTTSLGEELGIRDVRVFVEYHTNPSVVVESFVPNAEYFNCSFTHSVMLGDEATLNRTYIDFKLIEHLVYDSTDYPVEPIYVGDETIGVYSYTVYRIEPANYTQTMTVNLLLENMLKTFRTHVRGFDTETVLIGEPITIELPVTGNISIPGINKVFINVTSVTLKFDTIGTFTIEANVSLIDMWRLGLSRKTINVKYGAFSVEPIDVDSRAVDYENLVFQLINKTSGAVVREISGNKLFVLDELWAGNYSLRIKFKDIIVGAGDFELNITTDGSTITLPVPMKKLPEDYRGLNRTIALEYGKQLLSITNISTKYPYSRMSVLLNGTGAFTLYVNYKGDLPTKVKVEGNVTNLKYHWDGNYLVITGTLGSVGEINITDLYKIRLEFYDRLGNLMPSWMCVHINAGRYSYKGAIVEDYFYPEDYLIELPLAINGFEFYGFFDGYNETARTVTINHSDVTLKAWYRVPTGFEEVRGAQVSSLWRLPFIEQGGETLKVYVEGYLRDYYGAGVPNRPLVINVTNVETGYTRSFNVTTDVAGHFRSPIIELVRGKTYRVELFYKGDDIYVGSTGTLEVKPEELPLAPVVFLLPTEYLVFGASIAILGVAIYMAVRASRHAIEDVMDRRRKFVKRKRS